MTYPTPEQEAAWQRELAENLSAGIFRTRTDEPEPTHEPGDPVHISTMLGRVMARLEAARAAGGES